MIERQILADIPLPSLRQFVLPAAGKAVKLQYAKYYLKANLL